MKSEPAFSPSTRSDPTPKSVIMLYPINYFVEEDGRAALRVWGNFYTRALKLNQDIYRQRSHLINHLLDEYREQGYRVGWAVFASLNDPAEPDVTQFSSIFERRDSDYLLNVQITEMQHRDECQYPDEKTLLRTLQSVMGLEELVVGGFHYDDCVSRFNLAASRLGIKSKRDRLLTEHFFQAVGESFGQELYLHAMLTGHLDPIMHEDNPFEEQDHVFENRLGPISTPNIWVSARDDLRRETYSIPLSSQYLPNLFK